MKGNRYERLVRTSTTLSAAEQAEGNIVPSVAGQAGLLQKTRIFPHFFAGSFCPSSFSKQRGAEKEELWEP
jgi:hypothetical protein